MVSREPNTVEEELSQAHWKVAMLDDYLIRNYTCTLVSPSKNRRAIGCKWVFRVKANSKGCIEKYKSTLAAKSFHQCRG